MKWLFRYNQQKAHLVAVLLVVFTIGLVGGWYIRIWYISYQPGSLVEIRENSNRYHYINPLLLVDSKQEAPEYVDLKKSITNFIQGAESGNNTTSISVYFRDLNSAKWTGVNEGGIYDPSSMLKVAVMIGYLKKADTDPNILTTQLLYTPKYDSGQHYPPNHELKAGWYTVRELIEAMIIESDNQALAVLYNNDRSSFIDVLKSLDIPPPPNLDDSDFMSPKAYSAIFRTMYSSTYLPRNVSEQALQLLTYTTFKNGLVAGVPSGTIVAHKFGEHTSTTVTGQVVSRQLHDCGIIYYPNHPYLLCIMTKGDDFDTLQSVLESISKVTYTYISTHNK